MGTIRKHADRKFLHFNYLASIIGFATLALTIGGCASSYMVPGASADFRAMGITEDQAVEMTDKSIAQRLDRKPLAKFPTSIAIVRVQGPGYECRTVRGWGSGRYTVVTTRDVETDESWDQLTKLPMIAGLSPLNRLVMPSRLDTEEDLRKAAASVQADMLLVYTFDTKFGTDTKVAPLGIITLGLFPDREAHVTSTASAALVDTRNGYVYGLAEGAGDDDRITNAWMDEAAVDASRRQAEQEAFDGLVREVQKMWGNVVQRYGPQGSPPAG